MRIAIVDDEQIERDKLHEYLIKFGQETRTTLEISSFCSGDQLLKDYRLIYDIILFDIQMPGTNGMDSAKQIRKIDKGVTILFVTNVAQYAIEGYEVEAVDYVLKPILYPDFAIKMKKAFRKVAQKEDNTISVDTVDGMKNIRLSEIFYVEVMSHYLSYHTKAGEFKSRGSLKIVEAQLIPYNFFRMHKCYIVNLKYITALKTKEIMIDNIPLPLGRAYKDTFLQEYMRYIRG